MRFLIDTHTFLWMIQDNQQLSELARSTIESDADLWLSSGSLWEIAIKVGVKKLNLPEPLSDFLDQQLKHNEIDVLVPTTKHFETVSNLPLHHRDPFDRLIVAQAMTEGIPVISVDTAFDFYNIQRLW